MVVGCCTKPSHDLGRTDFFQSRFDELRQALIKQGVRRVLVLCPSCHAMFRKYGSPLQTEYVYSLLTELPLLLLPNEYITDRSATITVHDPCTTRQNSQVHSSVRKILNAASFKVKEMPHHGEKTLCCGEGGAVPFLRKDFARHWGDLRRQEAESRPIIPLTVTYCAGCVDFLRSRMRIVHLLDLLFAPEAALAGRAKVARAPFTYLNRLLLKRRFQQLYPGPQ
ncbi:MAG: (Fe-S)-binding protein [Candidatus Electrothrix sp. LOE2]|nr:(Fe-S)-binding protein [Candidatus Electrothrix sp. LOE2]